jgi:Arc/MetJ family transcription regulator
MKIKEVHREMRTTVTLESADVVRLMRETGLKSKAKAVGYAVKEALRLKAIVRQDGMCGKASFDRRVARWRHLGR